ncbi:GDSL family lipase [Paenibacillus sp. PK3_47]|uniref:SGNH/GDSL hydrolase family protein n=1 Tax=Paenibacillus sp. PK3_47 TaxID=2072642 RepID=UPI00201D6547|nr:SGNH/GDSL hydrolase family protein [Paenibacillus sp. PK3_47]UQZ35634.1 GDSL family lipase [Paenibacillus sp. PK3_47]
MRPLDLTDEWFHGAVSLEHRKEGIKPWRIPFADYDLFPPGGIGGKAEICSGVRLGFFTDSAELFISFAPLAEAAVMDSMVDGVLFQSLRLPAGETRADFRELPAGVKELEIYLPQNTGVTVTGLLVNAEAFCDPLPDARPKWVTYGSSITQCVAAASPSRTWPAIAAAACGFNLTNLGFSGNCHMEPMIGRMIRGLSADFISICAGVNIYGAATVSPRMFSPLLIGLLETIREGHPQTPLLVISPIYGTIRETEENPLGFTLPLMRSGIRETVELLRRRGDRHLYYVDGLDWLGQEDEALLTDGLHPGAEGYEVMGRRFPELLQAAAAPL